MTTPELKLENCWAFKTIAEWKKAARQAGKELEEEDYPNDAMGQRQQLQRLDAMATNKQIVISSLCRQNIRTVDNNGKGVVKEYLTVRGEFQITTDRGVPYSCEVEFGRYNRPNVVANPDQRFDNISGKELLPPKILSGNKTLFVEEFELPKDAKQRKVFIDAILKAGNTDPESIRYYYKDTDAGFRDATFSAEQFMLSIEELRDLSKRGGGAKGSGYWRDPKDGKLKDRDGNPVQ